MQTTSFSKNGETMIDNKSIERLFEISKLSLTSGEVERFSESLKGLVSVTDEILCFNTDAMPYCDAEKKSSELRQDYESSDDKSVSVKEFYVPAIIERGEDKYDD